MRNQQQGITLFIVIIILVLVTSLAAAVITQTRLGQHSIGLAQEKLTNEQELLGGFTEVMGNPYLINDIMALPAPAISGLTISKVKHVSVVLEQRGVSYCKRSANASSVNLINCRYVKMDFSQDNDRRVQGLAMTAGVEQPFLAAQNKIGTE
jgi:type IV pilus assembly protein PilX